MNCETTEDKTVGEEILILIWIKIVLEGITRVGLPNE
jgi:hypothetical protein